MDAVTVLLLWALICALQSGVAWLGGGLSDRFNKSTVVALTWLAYGFSLIVIATAHSANWLWIAVCVYALLTGAGEGSEKALVSDLARGAERGTAFGWYNMIAGLSAIPAGILFGLIWDNASAGAAFAAFGCVAVISGLAMTLAFPARRSRTGNTA